MKKNHHKTVEYRGMINMMNKKLNGNGYGSVGISGWYLGQYLIDQYDEESNSAGSFENYFLHIRSDYQEFPVIFNRQLFEQKSR